MRDSNGGADIRAQYMPYVVLNIKKSRLSNVENYLIQSLKLTMRTFIYKSKNAALVLLLLATYCLSRISEDLDIRQCTEHTRPRLVMQSQVRIKPGAGVVQTPPVSPACRVSCRNTLCQTSRRSLFTILRYRRYRRYRKRRATARPRRHPSLRHTYRCTTRLLSPSIRKRVMKAQAMRNPIRLRDVRPDIMR